MTKMDYTYQDEIILETFKEHGFAASYHFADDTGKEFDHGFSELNKAMEIYQHYPELQAAMRDVAKEFLWSIDRFEK